MAGTGAGVGAGAEIMDKCGAGVGAENKYFRLRNNGRMAFKKSIAPLRKDKKTCKISSMSILSLKQPLYVEKCPTFQICI